MIEKFKIKKSTLDQLAPEVQFWGPLSIDNVEKFIFLEVEPSGRFLNKLLEKNIKIYDGRNSSSEPVLWQPSY